MKFCFHHLKKILNSHSEKHSNDIHTHDPWPSSLPSSAHMSTPSSLPQQPPRPPRGKQASRRLLPHGSRQFSCPRSDRSAYPSFTMPGLHSKSGADATLIIGAQVTSGTLLPPPLLLCSLPTPPCACRPDSRVQQGKSEARFKLLFLYSSFVMFISLPHSGPVLEIVSFLIASDLETGPRSTLAGLRPHGYQADVLVCLGPSMGRQHISLFFFRFCLSRVFVSLQCQMRR